MNTEKVIVNLKLKLSTYYIWRGGGRLGEGNNFYQKNNNPFGRVKLFLPVGGKNRVTDTDDTIANRC